MSFTVSVNPTYLCNFRCDFCYLTEEQLADNNKLEVVDFDELFREVCSHKDVTHVDIYGGEVALLSNDYLEAIHRIIRAQSTAQVNVITNLSKTHDYFLRDDVTLSVSYDFECRRDHAKVLANILSLPKDVAILMLASPCLLEKDVGEMISVFNSIANVASVEIKPYSSNQANQLNIDYRDYEGFVAKWLEYPNKHFHFMNETHIKESLAGVNNAFSDDHVYITPNGRFGVLEFDDSDNEYFLELETFEDYIGWSNQEKGRVLEQSLCKQCEFKGRCLTEHYRKVESLDKSCNGYFNLLKYYEDAFLSK